MNFANNSAALAVETPYSMLQVNFAEFPIR